MASWLANTGFQLSLSFISLLTTEQYCTVATAVPTSQEEREKEGKSRAAGNFRECCTHVNLNVYKSNLLTDNSVGDMDMSLSII